MEKSLIYMYIYFSIVSYKCTLSRNNIIKVACQILERPLALKGGRAENVSIIAM